MKTEMSPEKSLEIITQMINESKETYKHHSFYFLLWGWLMISAALTEYYLLNIDYQFHFLPWIVFSVLGGIVSGLKGAKDKKRISTFADKVISYTWIGFVITMIITLIAVVPSNPNPFVLLLVGLATFITGGVTQFKGFVVGGIIFWVAATVSFQLEVQPSLLVYALAMFLGYIVPGYLLKNS
jgi:hypothetical protein